MDIASFLTPWGPPPLNAVACPPDEFLWNNEVAIEIWHNDTSKEHATVFIAPGTGLLHAIDSRDADHIRKFRAALFMPPAKLLSNQTPATPAYLPIF